MKEKGKDFHAGALRNGARVQTNLIVALNTNSGRILGVLGASLSHPQKGW